MSMVVHPKIAYHCRPKLFACFVWLFYPTIQKTPRVYFLWPLPVDFIFFKSPIRGQWSANSLKMNVGNRISSTSFCQLLPQTKGQTTTKRKDGWRKKQSKEVQLISYFYTCFFSLSPVSFIKKLFSAVFSTLPVYNCHDLYVKVKSRKDIIGELRGPKTR